MADPSIIPPDAIDDGDQDDYDDTPTFIDMSSAVEVAIPDGDAPMDEDDGDVGDVGVDQDDMGDDHPPHHQQLPDQSKATFASHADAVYAVSTHYDPAGRVLTIASGGGDDRAYLHYVTSQAGQTMPVTTTVPLSHPHTDSVSCVALNLDAKPQANLVAVGSYDGAIAVYDCSAAEDAAGALVKTLEGPSDVEWCCFHPKGGTVGSSSF